MLRISAAKAGRMQPAAQAVGTSEKGPSLARAKDHFSRRWSIRPRHVGNHAGFRLSTLSYEGKVPDS
jgi:hypothetical protein